MGKLLSRIMANKDSLCIIHYACTDVTKTPVKIPCIVVGDYATRNTQTFSILDENDEKNVLQNFYRYIQDSPNKICIGWNFKDVIYGLPVIARRYRELFATLPDIIIEDIIDLDDTIEEIHGKRYVDHGAKGKMFNLFELNAISTLNFLKGIDEAKYCEQDNIRPVEISTNVKVRGILDVLDLLIEDRLKTTQTINRCSRIRQKIFEFKNSTLFWIIIIIAAILTIVGFVMYTLGGI